MKKKIYTRPVSVMLSVDMFDQIKTITDQGDIGFSDFIREALQEKLNRKLINNKKEKGYETE
jgi:predicted DNA-binding WGR domain protein